MTVPVITTGIEVDDQNRGAQGGVSEVDDDTILTVGLLRQEIRREMRNTLNRYTEGIVGHVNQHLENEFKSRDDQLHILTSRYNLLLKEVHHLKKEQQENKIKLEEKKQPRKHSDHIFLVDGLNIVEDQDDKLTLVKLCNSKLKSLGRPITKECFLDVERVGKSVDGRPPTVRVVCNSDWTKKKLFRVKKELKGTQCYFREFLDKEMEDLSYNVRMLHKKGRFSHFYVRKEHVLIVPGGGLAAVKVWNQGDLIECMDLFKQMNVGENMSEEETGDEGEKDKTERKKKEEEGAVGGEGVPNLKDLYNVISQSLLLAQATNIRLGLSSIPLPQGEQPGVDDTLLPGTKENKPGEDKMDETVA